MRESSSQRPAGGRHLPLLALLLALALAAILYVGPAAGTNRLSLQHLDAVQDAQAGAHPAPPGAHPRAAYWQALQAIEGGDGPAALALLEPLAASGDPNVLQALGWAYEVAGDLPAAFRIWEQTGNAHALLQLAEAAARAGDLDTAQAAYSAAWALEPLGDSTAKLAQFLWRKRGDPGAAQEVLRWSLANCPACNKRPYWLLQLADLLEAQNRWAEAAEVQQDVLASAHLMSVGNRQEDLFYSDMAWDYHMSGQVDQAVMAIEQALALKPADAGHHLRAGQIYEAAGQVERALAAYRQVLALKPGNQAALEAVERLSNGQ